MMFRNAIPRLGMIMGLAATATAPHWAFAPAALAQEVAAQAAGTIRGTVTDPETGAPVAGATVLVLGTDLGALSEVDGTYVIEGVPPGAYQVQVLVYDQPAQTVAVDVAAGQPLALDLQAKASELAGEVIVVTGSRSPEKIFDAPVTVESVSEETLERTAGPSYLSALSNVKGIDFANAGLNDQRISMRGFTTQFNSRLLTMVDGRLAPSPGNGLPQANFLPSTPLDMKAIEVVVGPASALYGPNAHTGVINVITKTPWDESGASISLRGGSQEQINGAVRVAGTVSDSFGWKLNAEYMRAEDFKPDCEEDPAFRFGTSICETDVVADYRIGAIKGDGSLYYKFGEWMAKAVYGVSENTNFSATNAGRNHNRDLRISYQTAQLSHPNWYAQVTRTAGNGGRSYQLSRLVTLAGARAQTGESIEPDTLGDLRYTTRFADESELMDAEAQYRNTFAGVKTAVGVQGRVYTPDSDGTFLADSEGIDANEIGGYVQADYDVVPEKLRLVGALRVDEHSNYDPQVSPKVAAVLETAPGHKLRASYNRAFKSPTILENYLLIGGTLVGNRTGFEIRNMDGDVIDTIDPLVPEQVDAVELGYKGYVGRQVYIDIVVYNSWYRDFIGPLTPVANPASGTYGYYPDGTIVAAGQPNEGTLSTYQNFGEAEVRGADLGVDLYPDDRLTLSASASFIKLVSDAGNAPPLNVPGAKFKFSATVEDVLIDDVFVRLAGRFSSAYDFRSGYWVEDVKPIFVGDLTAGYTFRDLGVTVTGGIMNVFNNTLPEIPGAPVSAPLGFVQMTYAYQGLRY